MDSIEYAKGTEVPIPHSPAYHASRGMTVVFIHI